MKIILNRLICFILGHPDYWSTGVTYKYLVCNRCDMKRNLLPTLTVYELVASGKISPEEGAEMLCVERRSRD